MTRIIILAAVFAAAVGTSARAAEPGGGVRVAELSPETEKAIENGLGYLAKSQNKDGSWGGKYKVAVTSLSLMAFMLKGHFPEKGPYGSRLERGVAFLLRSAGKGGGYVGGSMYEHGLATLALSEVWGMSNSDEIRDTLKRAVQVILRSQSPRGGWRYHPQPRDADISVTVMQIVALTSAKEAGMHVPAKVIDKALDYVKSLQVPSQGGFGYTGPSQAGFARSAAGVMSLLMCGERKSRPVLRGLAYLRRYPARKFDTERHYYYGHYYAIQAMYQAGDAYYQEWYPKIRDRLIDKQNKDGSWPGSGSVGDPSYSTSMSILILGVPYRFLPIYQR